MYRIIDKRGTGKTSRLMLLAEENKGIIVTSNPNALKVKADSYGFSNFDIISYAQFINQCFYIMNKNVNKPIYIDEVEGLLKFMNNNVSGYSLTNED